MEFGVNSIQKNDYLFKFTGENSKMICEFVCVLCELYWIVCEFHIKTMIMCLNSLMNSGEFCVNSGRNIGEFGWILCKFQIKEGFVV